jgi:hypothetical protein
VAVAVEAGETVGPVAPQAETTKAMTTAPTVRQLRIRFIGAVTSRRVQAVL